MSILCGLYGIKRAPQLRYGHYVQYGLVWPGRSRAAYFTTHDASQEFLKRQPNKELHFDLLSLPAVITTVIACGHHEPGLLFCLDPKSLTDYTGLSGVEFLAAIVAIAHDEGRPIGD